MIHLDRRNIIVDHWLPRLPVVEFAVLCIYDRHAGDDCTAWPANNTVAKKAGHNQDRHIRRARQRLVEKGLLQYVGRHPHHKSDIYRITLFVPPVDQLPHDGVDVNSGIEEGEGGTSGPRAAEAQGAHDAPPGTGGARCAQSDSVRGHEMPTKGDRKETVKNMRGEGPGEAGENKTKRPRKAPTGQHAEAIAYYGEKFNARYGTKYRVDGGKDGKLFSDILRLLDGDLAAFKATADAYFADPDPFLTKGRHPVGLLRSQINRFTPAAAGDTPKAAPADGIPWNRRKLTDADRRELSRPSLPGEPGYVAPKPAHDEVI